MAWAYLVLWVVNLGWLPFSVHLIIPVVGFLGIWVGDVLRLVPVLWFLVIRVINLFTLIPVIGLLGFWILQYQFKNVISSNSEGFIIIFIEFLNIFWLSWINMMIRTSETCSLNLDFQTCHLCNFYNMKQVLLHNSIMTLKIFSSHLDLLWWKEVPVLLKLSTFYFLIIDLDHIGVIRIDNKSVQVSEDIIFTTDFFLAKQVLSFVVKNDMNLLGAWSTNIRS